MTKDKVIQIRCSKQTKQKWVELVAKFGGHGNTEKALLYYIDNYERFRNYIRGGVIP